MTDHDPLAPVERWITTALERLNPSARKTLFRDIGRQLRQRNARRILRQTGPDGTPWAPRKLNAKGKIRDRAKMLQGLREARRLALKADASGMELGYTGRNARRASVHHGGEVDAVAKDGPRIKYPARPLLGLSPEDLAYVRDRLMAALDPG